MRLKFFSCIVLLTCTLTVTSLFSLGWSTSSAAPISTIGPLAFLPAIPPLPTPARPIPDDPPRTEPNSASDFSYTMSGSQVTITGYRGPSGDVVIPEVIDGKNVTIIDSSAFLVCYDITRITVPSSVTSIGNWAFSDCPYLMALPPKSLKWYKWKGGCK